MPLGVGAPAGVARAPAHRRAGLAQGAPQCRLLGVPVPSRPSSLVCDVHGGRPSPVSGHCSAPSFGSAFFA